MWQQKAINLYSQLNVLKSILLLSIFFCTSSFADQPVPWQTGFQVPATPTMEKIHALYYFMLAILTVIVIFVAALMIYVLLKFNAKANPTPTKTSHNVTLEILWTAIPVVLLTIIAVPTFKIIYFASEVPEAELTLKVVGHQWYWSYEYPDNGGIAFDSYMIQDKDLKPGQKRLLDVDNRVVLPAKTIIRIQVTGGDVIHSFAVPSFGIKTDAIPGRVNETWIKVDNPGVYYGQCSELCGAQHAFMPIAVEIVSKEDFQKWLEQAKIKYAERFSNPYKILSQEYAR
jgi:cytochrome c oxidase subunit 2